MDQNLIASIAKDDVAKAVSGPRLFTSRILHLALMAGPLAFGGVIYAVHLTRLPNPEAMSADPGTSITTLLMALVAIAVPVYGFALLLEVVLFKPKKLLSKVSLAATGDKASAKRILGVLMGQHMVFTVIRLALTEGVALFGLMVIFMEVNQGNLAEVSMAWLGGIPTAIHILVGALTFPNRRNLTDFVYNKMVQPLQRLQGSF